uniref:Uncharacterized protein n=1 Tax=Canis lupus dingo TaxID=286419 RepID=A0A8C0KXW6_CANLU
MPRNLSQYSCVPEGALVLSPPPLHTHELMARMSERLRARPVCPGRLQRPLPLRQVLVQDPSVVCHLAHVGATDAHQLPGRIWIRSCAFSPRIFPSRTFSSPFNMDATAGQS